MHREFKICIWRYCTDSINIMSAIISHETKLFRKGSRTSVDYLSYWKNLTSMQHSLIKDSRTLWPFFYKYNQSNGDVSTVDWLMATNSVHLDVFGSTELPFAPLLAESITVTDNLYAYAYLAVTSLPCILEFRSTTRNPFSYFIPSVYPLFNTETINCDKARCSRCWCKSICGVSCIAEWVEFAE